MAITLTPTERVFGTNDLRLYLFKLLPPMELKNCSNVCKLWRNHILNDQQLYSMFLVGCVEHSLLNEKILTPHLRNVVVVNLVVLHLLRRDSNRVTEMLAKIQDPFRQAQALINGTLQMDVSIGASSQQNEADKILSVLREAKTCLEGVNYLKVKEKDEQLLRVVRVEAVYNHVVARETCELIRQSREEQHLLGGSQIHSESDSALCEIIKVIVKENISEAEAVLEKVILPQYRIKAFCEIAKYKQEAIEDAKALLPQLPNTPQFRDEALLDIVKVEALFNPYEAEETSLLIEYARVKAYEEIARTSFNENRQGTIEWGSLIEGEYYRKLVQYEIARLEGNLTHALTLAKELFSEGDLVSACIEIGKIDPNHDFSEAKRAVEALNEQVRDFWRIDIAVAEAPHHVENARLTASQITNRLEKTRTYLKLAEQVPPHLLKETLSQVFQIEQLSDRILVVFDIAKSILRGFRPMGDNI